MTSTAGVCCRPVSWSNVCVRPVGSTGEVCVLPLHMSPAVLLHVLGRRTRRVESVELCVSVGVCQCQTCQSSARRSIHLHLELDRLPLPSVMLKPPPPQGLQGSARLLVSCRRECVCVSSLRVYKNAGQELTLHFSGGDHTSKVSLVVCSQRVQWLQSGERARRRIEKREFQHAGGEGRGTIAIHPL